MSGYLNCKLVICNPQDPAFLVFLARIFAFLVYHARTFTFMLGQGREARTGITEQADRTSRMGQAKQDIQNRTGRTGKEKHDRQNRTG